MDDVKPSKSQLKRDMHRFQSIGESLIAMKAEQLDSLTISDPLRLAIDEAKRLKSREGLRRQKQFIGKLMKHEDVEEIESQLSNFETEKRSQDRHFKTLEALREKLLKGGNDAVNEVVAANREIDRSKLRQLIKKSKIEISENRPASAQKQLFRFLREHIGQDH